MIKFFFIIIIIISGCGKKGSLSLDKKELLIENTVNQERIYKF